jgi:4'-phosphopantetheinyl transferase
MILILHTTIGNRLAENHEKVLLGKLPADLQMKIKRYLRWQDAQACLLGKLLLIEGLQRFGVDGAALIHQLQHTNFGRPYLPGRIDFNISHSGDFVLCALSDQSRVGIDIEKVHDVKLSDFRSQMTDEEWRRVTGDADPTRAFFYYWTKKEAAIKAHGHGLGLPLKDVVIGNEKVAMEGADWPLFEIELSIDYVCHLVTGVGVGRQDVLVQRVVF